MGDETFRAGRLQLTDGKLVADRRKGAVKLTSRSACVASASSIAVQRLEVWSGVQLGDEAVAAIEKVDGQLRLQWLERVGSQPAAAAELTEWLTPGAARVERIVRPGSRVLAFHRPRTESLFFWLQEPAAFDDAALACAISERLTAVPATAAPQQSPTQQAAPPPPPQQQQEAQTAPQSQPATSPAMSYRQAAMSGGPPAGEGSGRIDAAMLAAALSGAGGGAGGDASAQMAAQLQEMQRRAEAGPGLSDVMAPETLVPLLTADGMLERLAPHLPEEHRNAANLVATVQSPQFRRALDVFSAALVSGRLDLRHFGLQPSGFSIADFLQSIQSAADANEGADMQE